MTPDTPAEPLKPCPFCGGEASCRPDDVGSGGQHVAPYHAGCRRCRIFFTEHEPEDARSEWNRRATPAEIAQPATPSLRHCTDCGEGVTLFCRAPVPFDCKLFPQVQPATPEPAERPTPEGWVLVPVVPTDHMMLMGGFSFCGKVANEQVFPEVRKLWDLMLANAPAAPLLDTTQPATHVALTDEQILNIGPCDPDAKWSDGDILYFAREVIRAALATRVAFSSSNTSNALGVPAQAPSGSVVASLPSIPDAAGEVQHAKLKSPMWDMPSDELRKVADREHPKPEPGLWLLQSPSGRQFTADSPMRCLHAEVRTRIPADVALARIILGSREDE